jgi:hypothetical protein
MSSGHGAGESELSSVVSGVVLTQRGRGAEMWTAKAVNCSIEGPRTGLTASSSLLADRVRSWTPWTKQ